MIHILPENIANQIAAGEVVERPASVVKELVENSIDAGATRITVESDQGGRILRVIDNGSGIPRQSLELAFKRFATSKLTRIDDIWNLSTMGFRGEALPSIASISKVEIISRTADSETAYQLTIQGGEVLSQFECTAPVGTSIKISELFFNTPARLKFMRTDNTELGYIQQLMTAFALGLPELSFKWFKNGKEIISTSGQGEVLTVMRQIYGKDIADSLFLFSNRDDFGVVSGALSYPHLVRRDRNRQFIFVNKRWIKDIAINKVIENLYADLVPKKHYPVMVLNLDVPQDIIDVNVHPTKKEVKFKSFKQISQLISKAIQQELSAYKIGTSENNYSQSFPSSFSAPNQESSIDTELAPFEKNQYPISNPVSLPSYSPAQTYSASPGEALNLQRDFNAPSQQLELNISSTSNDSSSRVEEFNKNKEPLKDIIPISQFGDNTYILAHYGNGLAIIDQHVAEERYYYEKFLKEKKVASQLLLMSVMFELDAIDISILNENRDVIETFGFEFDIFDENSIAVKAVPQYLRVSEVEIVIKDLLQDLRETETTKTHLERFNYLCKSMACHTAIRAGDVLSKEQIDIIVNNWKKTQNPYTCPHGRPILLKFTKHELDRRFLRI